MLVARARTVLARPRVAAGLPIAGTVLALAATTAAFLLLNKKLTNNGLGYDEEFFLWGGWCIRKGLVPYRDFIEFKPPMVFMTTRWRSRCSGSRGRPTGRSSAPCRSRGCSRFTSR